MINLFGKIFDKFSVSFNFLNRESSPSNQVSIRDASTGSIQQAGRDIHNITVARSEYDQERPQIDSDQWGGTSGPDGSFIEFYAKNIGEKVAVDVEAELVADDSSNIKVAAVASNLLPGQSSRLISYRYDSTDFFKRALKNPRIIFKFKSADDRSFVSGRSIIQESRAAGGFNIHTKQPTSYFNDGTNQQQK